MNVKTIAVCFAAFLGGVFVSQIAAEDAQIEAEATSNAQSSAQAPEAESAQAPAAEVAAPQQAAVEASPAPLVSESEVRSDLQELEAEVREVDPHGRLTSEQLFQILMEREKQRMESARFDPAPVVLTVFATSSLLMGFLGWLYAAFRKERQRHETVRLMVEKGVEIPSGLLAPAPKRPSDLRRGLILSTTGLGLTIFLAAIPGAHGVWGAGVTLLLIGAGHLLVWRVQGGKGSWSSALASEA